MPLRGIKNDLRGRLTCYKQDWTGGFRAGIRYDAQEAASRICGVIAYLLLPLCSFWSKIFTLGMAQDLEAYCDFPLLALCNWHKILD